MNAQDNPRCLRIVAGLFVFSGVCAVVEVLVCLLSAHVQLNFNVLGLWIGPGLLRHDRTWRTWAIVFLWIRLIAIPVFCVLALGRGVVDVDPFGIPLGQVPSVFGLAFAAVLFPVALWQYRVLTRPDIRQLFEDPC